MKVLGTLLLLLLVLFGAAAFFVVVPHAPPGEVFVDLPAGTGTSAMADRLQAAGVLRSRYAFLALRAWKRGSLKAGEYRFVDPASALDVYGRIARGDVYTRTVTIPEGFNLYDIAAAVQSAGLGSATEFLQGGHRNTDLIATWSPAATSLEGYLYPDTYRFSRHATVRSMQAAMVARFRTAAGKLGLAGNLQRTVTLASLVEKEVRFDDERGLAAGVFENRLAAGMPLQTDPTVIYTAMLAGSWSGTIHQSDLQRASPYNTYRQGGLPPGPICSPGAAALRAAAHPTLTDKLYFVADHTGHTKFSAGLKEHAQQVESYRQGLPR
ncbi:MAG: endolytic transglycosylase MltG [Janthinobacterium lividum]